MSSYSMKRDMVATIRARTSSVCVCLVLKSSMTIGNCVDFLVVCVLLEKTRVKDGWAVIMHFKGPRAILASPEAKDATLIAWLPSITKLFLELLWFVDTQTMLENAKCPNHWSRHWRDKRPFHTHLWTCNKSAHKEGLSLICCSRAKGKWPSGVRHSVAGYG